MAAVLSVEGLTKRFGDAEALSHVTLDIQPGEIFALLGRNGAGKTTLIGVVCGLVKKSEGKVRLFGTDLDQDALSPRFHVGLVPQEVNFDPFFSAVEALRLQQGYYGLPPDEDRVQEVLAAMKLTDKQNAPTRALSGGMKRRLLIAKALVHRPKLVFLDEPTAGVDVELRQDLWTYVRKLRSEGTTFILTTHYLEEAEELADRVGVLDKGKLLLVEEKTALMNRLGEKRLEVSFASPLAPNALPSHLLADSLVSENRQQLIYTERSGRPAAGEVLRHLYGNGLPITAVETRRSRLEDVLRHILRGNDALGTETAEPSKAAR
jgi:ABC-2 type transport system ATP-binding protein